MTKSCIVSAILAAGLCLTASVPARAQIASYVDEHGRLVYTNADSPSRRSGSTISSPAAALAKSASPAAPITPPDRLERLVREAAERHKVDPNLIKAVISTESGWNPYAISRKGAVGLMQLIPGTAQRYGVGNPFDPAQNVEGGTSYLRALLDHYNGNVKLTLAAYNAGEGLVDRSGGVPRIWETQRYVQKVARAYRPGSGYDMSAEFEGLQFHNPVRQEVDSKGRVLFTNE